MSKVLKQVREKYSTFSGADVIVLMGGVEIGNATSYVVRESREKVPQYVFGDPDPKAFTRGPRHISGQMTGLMMHMDNFVAAMNELIKNPDADIYKIGDEFIEERMAIGGITGNVKRKTIDKGFIADLLQFKPLYLNELPPVDLLVVGVNEFGAAGKTEVIGAEFITNTEAFNSETSSGIEQVDFVARAYVPWQPISK